MRDEASKLDRLRWGSTWRFWFSFIGLLLVGVVFFPSLAFIGVMLFPIFAIGNASGEGSALLVSFSPFSILFSLPLLSSPSPSFLLFFSHLILPFPFPSAQTLSIPFSSSPLFHLFPFLFLPFFFIYFHLVFLFSS